MVVLERLQAGRTTFIIAHRPSMVQTADLIVVVKDGRIEDPLALS
jgi:ABC-type multidrug transport system fused ATPase/permease subunit